MAIMSLAREWGIKSGKVIQSHPNSKNEEICMCVGISALLVNNGGARQRTIYTRIGWFGVREIGWLTRKRSEMDCVRWHAIVHMSCFVTLVKDPNASHANPYACEGFQYFNQLLMPGQAADVSHANHLTTPYASAGSQRVPHKSSRCAGSRQFKSFLTLVLASDNLDTNPEACEGPQQFKKFLMPGQASYHSHANAYACESSNNAENSLRLCRLLSIHTQILTLVKVPDNANNSIHD
ncbi:hypothetical protein O181_125093 [Austropuccinia psidii MF-1]|uniref:Uncharacterized protein n=1 Tax=Austropuccinia psidii MF-1 TaxID=1389203 RepID=A0A9Q3Q4Q6_9BASI|nr:hypothetical protein [Austropuccinia psidii MF-1]